MRQRDGAPEVSEKEVDRGSLIPPASPTSVAASDARLGRICWKIGSIPLSYDVGLIDSPP